MTTAARREKSDRSNTESTSGPLCTEALFAAVLDRMVADSAPHQAARGSAGVHAGRESRHRP